MIYIENLILRTMVLEYFKKSPYFKSYVPWYKDHSKPVVQRPLKTFSGSVIPVQNPGLRALIFF